jgi:hypothetical protein
MRGIATGPTLDPAKRARIIELFKAGRQITTLTKAVGSTEATVRRALIAAGLITEDFDGMSEHARAVRAAAEASDGLLDDLRRAHAAPPADVRAPREPVFRQSAVPVTSGAGSPAAACAES